MRKYSIMPVLAFFFFFSLSAQDNKSDKWDVSNPGEDWNIIEHTFTTDGIPECWIIDIDGSRLEILLDPEGSSYSQSEIYSHGDNVTLMGQTLAVKDLLLLT